MSNYDPHGERYRREWFEWACSENTIAMQQALDEEQDIDEILPEFEGRTAASVAAERGLLRLFEWLREQGADFKKFDGRKMNALMCSAQKGTVKIASRLLSRGDPVNSITETNEDGQCSLHFAAKGGSFEMTQFLVSKIQANKVDPRDAVNAKDSEGNTPLHLAMRGNAYVVAALLEAGADPTVENAKGQTPEKFPGANAACRNALRDGGGPRGGMGSIMMMGIGGSGP